MFGVWGSLGIHVELALTRVAHSSKLLEILGQSLDFISFLPKLSKGSDLVRRVARFADTS